MIMQDLLEKIKIRPEIYLGEKSFTRLIAFIRGYEYCQNKYQAECSILEGFDDYVHSYYRLSKNNVIDFEKNILLFSAFNDVIAFDKFFQIDEKFEKIDEKFEKIDEKMGNIHKSHNIYSDKRNL